MTVANVALPPSSFQWICNTSTKDCGEGLVTNARTHPYVRVRKKKKKKNFQTTSKKQQPHRPFLRSRVPVRVWPYMRSRTCKKTKQLSNRVSETTTTQAVPSLSCARMCVAVRAKTKPRALA